MILMSASNVLEAVGVSMYHESKIVSSLVYKRATCQCAVCTVVWDAFTHIVVAMAKWSKYRLAEEFDTVWALLHRAVASVVAADRLVVGSAFCDLGTLRQMFDDGLRRSKHDAENVWPSDSLIGGSSMRLVARPPERISARGAHLFLERLCKHVTAKPTSQ